MTIGWILSLSILAQLLAAVLAFRLNWLYRRHWAWTLISIAVVLMAVRRGLVLYRVTSGDQMIAADLSAEVVGLVISCLMLAGVALLDPFLRAIGRTEK